MPWEMVITELVGDVKKRDVDYSQLEWLEREMLITEAEDIWKR